MQEGNRLVALAIWHRLGYPIKSYLVVDFDRRLVELRQAPEEPEGPMGSRALGTYLPTPLSYGPGRSRTSRQFGRRRFPAWRDSGRRLRGTVSSSAEGPVGRTRACSHYH